MASAAAAAPANDQCDMQTSRHRLKSKPERKHYIIPAKRVDDNNLDSFLDEQRLLTSITPASVNSGFHNKKSVTQRRRHVSFKEPLETFATIEDWEDHQDVSKLRHHSGDSGIESVNTDCISGENLESSIASDIAQYPESLQCLLRLAYNDMSSLGERNQRKVLRMLLVQVWKNEGFEEKAAYTCSCLIQKEYDSSSDHSDSFCRVIQSSCANLIQDSVALKDHFHQWEKFIIFLHHLSCSMKLAEFHHRLQNLVTQALNVTLALLKLSQC